MAANPYHHTESQDSVLPSRGNARSWIRPILVIALLLRIGAAFAVDGYLNEAGRPFLIEGDANGYWELAENISAGKDYSIYSPPRYILRVPGFPVLLSASICMFGNSILAARLILAVIGTACCWLTYLLGKRVADRTAGIAAALYVAINPIHIGNNVLILSETWFTFWMMLSLLCVARFFVAPKLDSQPEQSPLAGKALLTGALIGLTVLVRPGFLPWTGIVCVAILMGWKSSAAGECSVRRVPIRNRILQCGAIVLGCGMVMLPWAIRNYRVTGHVVITSLWSGPSLYDGLNPNADGTSDMQFFEDDQVMTKMSEFQMNEHYKQKAVEFVRRQPAKAVSLAIPKAKQYLSPVPNSLNGRGWAIRAGCISVWLLMLLGLTMGLKSQATSKACLLLSTGPFLLFLLVHMVFVGSVRYRLPVEFPLAVLAAIGWRDLVMLWNNRKSVAADR